MVRGLYWRQPHTILKVNTLFFFILKFYFLRQLFTFIKTKEKNRGWAKGVFLLPDPKYAVELVGKNRLVLLCPENCCWNTTCLLILLSLALPLPQLLQLWVTSEVRCARDVNSHRHPCTKEFLAYANRDQSRGNLKYSLKDAEFTRLLLIFFFFCNSAATSRKAYKIYLSHKSPRIGPTGVSDQSNSALKCLHPDTSTGNGTNCCNSMIQLIKEKVTAQILRGFTQS